MSGNNSKIIAFNYFGGKFSWLNDLYKNFPTHFKHLHDVFGGSLVVSLNYPGNVIKTANEKNELITNFFRVLRDQPDELIDLLRLTPCSINEFNNSWDMNGSNLERARKYYVRARQSFFGLGAQRQNKGFHLAKTQTNCQGGETVSRWKNGTEKLLEVAMAIRNEFQITNYDYLISIDKIDFEDAFHYCDPPYAKESRASYNDYMFEFSDDDHFNLSEKLKSVKGKFMINGYECPLINELYKDFRKVKLPVKKNNIRSSEVQEVIWMNYEQEKPFDLFNN